MPPNDNGIGNLPFVSLIIVNYNGASLLPECIGAIRQLDYPREKLELIFVDDCSADASAEIISSLCPGAKIIKNHRNLGPAESKNKGMKSATGEYVAFLDNDVTLTAGWLKEALRVILPDSKVGAVASKLLFAGDKSVINSAGGIVDKFGDARDRGVYEPDNGQYQKNERVFFACSAAMLIRRSLIEKIGLFDGDYYYLYEDLDYCWRINLSGSIVLYAAEAVAYHKFSRTMGRGGRRVKYLTERNRLLTLLKNYELKALLSLSPALIHNRPKKFFSHLGEPHFNVFNLFFISLKAWVWNLIYAHETLKKRRAIISLGRAEYEKVLNFIGNYR